MPASARSGPSPMGASSTRWSWPPRVPGSQMRSWLPRWRPQRGSCRNRRPVRACRRTPFQLPSPPARCPPALQAPPRIPPMVPVRRTNPIHRIRLTRPIPRIHPLQGSPQESPQVRVHSSPRQTSPQRWRHWSLGPRGIHAARGRSSTPRPHSDPAGGPPGRQPSVRCPTPTLLRRVTSRSLAQPCRWFQTQSRIRRCHRSPSRSRTHLCQPCNGSHPVPLAHPTHPARRPPRRAGQYRSTRQPAPAGCRRSLRPPGVRPYPNNSPFRDPSPKGCSLRRRHRCHRCHRCHRILRHPLLLRQSCRLLRRPRLARR